MNEEQLKEICKEIWYEYWDFTKPVFVGFSLFPVRKDVREIIFTKDFIEKYSNYVIDNYLIDCITDLYFELMNNLDNPVWYLHNLISNK